MTEASYDEVKVPTPTKHASISTSQSTMFFKGLLHYTRRGASDAQVESSFFGVPLTTSVLTETPHRSTLNDQ